MPNIIQIRRDTTTNWFSKNPILAQGEFGINLTTGKFKIGDGVTAWNSLAYSTGALPSGGTTGQVLAKSSNNDYEVQWTTNASGDMLKSVYDTNNDGIVDTAAVANSISASNLPSNIDANKIADGTISNTEFQYLNNLTGNIQSQIDGKVAANSAISGATKTKITYDSKGLVTSGSDANIDDLNDVVITTPSNNQVLKYDGTNWVNATVPSGANALDDLTDVTITTPSTNQVLKYDGTKWVNGTGSTVGALDDLSDVTITTPSTGQVLKYDGTKWVNDTDAGGLSSLNSLTAGTQTFATGTSGTDFGISSATSTHTFNLPVASATNTGKLSSTDWSTFNSKEPALSKGNLTEATSAVLTISSGTGAVIGSGTSIEVKQSSGSQSGYLSSTDWTTFNGKQAQLNGTGFVKVSGTTVSYDNSTYLTAALTSLGTSGNGQTGATQTLATGTTGTDFGIVSSGNTHTFNIPDAGASARGLVTTGTQTLAGAKTFTSNPSISINQNDITYLLVTNTTAGTGSASRVSLTSDASAGSGTISKLSSTFTTTKIANASDLYIYNGATAGSVAILSDSPSGTVKVAAGGSSTPHLFINNTGNIGFGTTTTTTAKFTVTGSQTASGGVARGKYNTVTLVAAANSDTLVALDIAPTYTLGAYTGVTKWGLRVTAGGATVATAVAGETAFQATGTTGTLMSVTDTNTGDMLKVNGTNGTLLTVTDTVTGDIFNVNDSGGTARFKVNSNGALYQNSITVTGFSSATNTIISIDKTTGNSARYDYVLWNASTGAYRAGTLTAVWDGTNIAYTETTSTDLVASTSAVTLSADISSGNTRLIAAVSSGTWNIKIGARIV